MEIKDLSLEIIESMNTDQLRDIVKSEHAKIQMEAIERAKAEEAERARQAEGKATVEAFFARKFAHLKK